VVLFVLLYHFYAEFSQVHQTIELFLRIKFFRRAAIDNYTGTQYVLLSLQRSMTSIDHRLGTRNKIMKSTEKSWEIKRVIEYRFGFQRGA
jgi:hypothetical protein